MSDRLYYSDSFLKTFKGAVTDIREASRSEGQSLWQIALDRTAFYPSSGGQPFDTGVLRAVSRAGAVLEAPVESVEEDEQGNVWHFTLKPLLTGTEVEGEIDWKRRLDHIQQHSGQHLLSAVFAKELDAKTVSFHLGEEISTIDLSSVPPARHSIERVERLANELIAEDRPVRIHTASREEAEAMLAAGKLSKLPERVGAIRLIEIEDYDLNACGGTHVRSTGQIGSLLIRGVEKVSRGVRVEFVCGLRAVAAARHDHALLAQAAALVSAGGAELPAAIERLQGEAKSTAKERQRLREELAAYQAVQLAVEVQIEQGLRLVSRVYQERDREYIRLLASRLSATVPQTVALFCSTDTEPASIVLAHSGDMDFHCGQLLKESLALLGLRGGGSSGMAQGEVPRASMDELRALLTVAIRNAIPTGARAGRAF